MYYSIPDCSSADMSQLLKIQITATPSHRHKSYFSDTQPLPSTPIYCTLMLRTPATRRVIGTFLCMDRSHWR